MSSIRSIVKISAITLVAAGAGFWAGCVHTADQLSGLASIGLMGEVRALTTIVELSNSGERDKASHAQISYLDFLRHELILKRQHGFGSTEADRLIDESQKAIDRASSVSP